MELQTLSSLLPPLPELLAFIAAGLLLNFIPGPDMLYVIVQSSAGNLKRGLLAALAIGCGTLFHVAVLSLGLAGLLQAVPLAFSIVRLLGAALLVWMGLSMLWGRPPAGRPPEAAAEQGGDTRSFLQGMLTNILNPKVALFFLAFLPQFVDPQRGPASLQLALLGLIFDVNGTLVLLAIAAVVSLLSRRILRSARAELWLRRCGGLVLLALGLRLLLQRRPA